jgi:hypothetical protein
MHKLIRRELKTLTQHRIVVLARLSRRQNMSRPDSI